MLSRRYGRLSETAARSQPYLSVFFAQPDLRLTSVCHPASSMAWLPDEEMGDKQLRTVILRLVLDRWGVLLHGEVADADGRVMRRIRGWEEMLASIQACLAGTKAQ